MRPQSLFGAAACAAVVWSVVPSDARACGGCVVPAEEETVVAAHRMALSVSPTQTTLWDQIEYAGEPESFAWVLPTRGLVTVGLSSDLLFESLEELTQVRISPPPATCPSTTCTHTGTGTGTATGIGSGTGVDVLASEVVGPYELVQLSADDPGALFVWLDDHGYDLPLAIAPVVQAYVDAGFDFLAVKLVPGAGIDKMRPLRVTSPGANLTLPLRMVAAGTGATTSLELWVLGEGRYQPQNMPSFTIEDEDLVWDFATSSSNYTALKQAGFASSGFSAWLVSSSLPVQPWQIANPIELALSIDPVLSGYGAEDGAGAAEEAEADLDALFGDIPTAELTVTRLDASLAKAALGQDLVLGAAADQSVIAPVRFVTRSVGLECPEPPTTAECTGTPTETGSAAAPSGSAARGDAPAGDSSCRVGHTGGLPTALAVGLIALGWSVRRRGRDG